jgi:hypothetical protein
MSDVIGRLLDDRAVVARVARAATGGRHVGSGVGAVEVDPIPATSMATGAVARVRGNLTFDHETTTWSVVLKVVHSPDRSPIWTQIPSEFHDITLAQIPWRAEPELYRSALPDLLPAGLRMPATYHVDEIDDGAMAIWMEDVAHADGPWTLGDYRRAARLLGRLAGRFPESTSGALLPLRRRDLRFYFTGRVGQAVLPALRNDSIWAHPLIAPVVGPGLRGDLHALAGVGLAILDQVDALPRTLAHCDACPQNLLRGVDGDVVAIDWQLSGWCAVGFDVGQLIAGHAQSGNLVPRPRPDAGTGAPVRTQSRVRPVPRRPGTHPLSIQPSARRRCDASTRGVRPVR